MALNPHDYKNMDISQLEGLFWVYSGDLEKLRDINAELQQRTILFGGFLRGKVEKQITLLESKLSHSSSGSVSTTTENISYSSDGTLYDPPKDKTHQLAQRIEITKSSVQI